MARARDQRRKMAELGRKGGRATVHRHGVAHMSTIGRKGFMATVARHWQGDRAGFLRWLQWRAAVVVFDGLADAELARQLAGGATVASIELPY